MGLDLTLSGFISAGGGVAYVLAAILWGFSRGAKAERLVFTALLVTSGLFIVNQSLTTPEAPRELTRADQIGLATICGLAALTTLAGAALALIVAQRTSRRALALVTLALVALATLLAVALAQGGITPGKGDPALIPAVTKLAYASFFGAYGATAVAAAALALRWRKEPSTGAALVAVGLAVFPTVMMTWSVARTPIETLFAAFAVACLFAWLPPWPERGTRSGLAILFGLLAWALLGMMWPILPGIPLDTAALAPVNVLAALALSMALVRHGVWGVSPPAFARDRGATTAVALAALLIVAEVAQNFLSARYGLLMGGLVAGALLFAAQPIQRAMDRFTQGPASPLPAGISQRREEAYRKALRVALADRTLTPEESVHLYELAEELGIGAGRAAQIRREVEATQGAERTTR